MSWKNIPNILTTLRILFIFPIAYALLTTHYAVAFYLFIFAGLSDCLDGLLARRFHWTSRYGAITDPIADKLLLMSSFIILGFLGYLPVWLIAIVIGRDIWILCGAIAYHLLIGEPDFAPSQISKLNTFFQILLIGMILFSLGLFKIPAFTLQPLTFTIAIMSILSFIDYSWVWGLRAWRTRKKLLCP